MKKKKNNRILIVDDESINLKVLKFNLGNDYDVREATSGEEALEIIEDFSPALILLDVMMEGIDGYEVTKRIKNRDHTKSVKVILVTGKTMIEEKLKGYQIGAEDYITKPFNSEELKAKVKVFMNLHNFEAELNELNENLEKEVIVRSEQLVKSERMAFVGMQTSEIIHNLKNPLLVMSGYMQRLQKKYPDIKEIKKIDSAAEKMLETIRNILNSFNRDVKKDMEDVLLSEVIKDEVAFLTNIDKSMKGNINVKLSLKKDSSVYALRSHLSQIFGNIVKNAVDAMNDVEEAILEVILEEEEEFSIIVIRDNGHGISEENMEKIFNPLFTTKDGSDGKGHGNGLGLSFCKRMIESYGGQLNLSSVFGEGTEIRIKLPKNGIHSHNIEYKNAS